MARIIEKNNVEIGWKWLRNKDSVQGYKPENMSNHI
jgi:hypothetical protein